MKKNKTLIELIIGALIFSVSLAWNNAFQNAFEEIPYLKINHINYFILLLE